jgi:hypothetical protein
VNAAADLQVLKAAKLIPEEAADDTVVLNELLPHHKFFKIAAQTKTTRVVIKAMVDITAAANADAMMLDTSVLSKVSSICLVDTSQNGMANLSPFIGKDGLKQRGILSLGDLEYFVEYSHFKGIVPNIAGSVDSIQAQQLWALLPALDQVSTRGAASAALVEPEAVPVGGLAGAQAAVDTRQLRTIVRQLVRGLAPPEHGGVLNVPDSLRGVPEAAAIVQKLRRDLSASRSTTGLPPLRAYYVDAAGVSTPIPDDPPGPQDGPAAQVLTN